MKQVIFIFLLAGIFLASCASDPCKNNKDKADTTKVKHKKTVQALDSIKKGDTVLIVLNGKTYEVAGIESEPEKETSTEAGNKMLKASTTNKPCESESFDGSDRKAAKLPLLPAVLLRITHLQISSNHFLPMRTWET